MKVLVFGNRLVKKDSGALELMPDLKNSFKNVEFIEVDSTENLDEFGRVLYIIDVVDGVDSVCEIGLDDIALNTIYTMHDFDLGFNLKLLKKAGKIDSVKIIAVPLNGVDFNQIQLILRKWVAQLMHGS